MALIPLLNFTQSYSGFLWALSPEVTDSSC